MWLVFSILSNVLIKNFKTQFPLEMLNEKCKLRLISGQLNQKPTENKDQGSFAKLFFRIAFNPTKNYQTLVSPINIFQKVA